MYPMMMNPMMSNLPNLTLSRKKDAAAPMESALSEEQKIKSIEEIIDLVEALPITVQEKYQTLVKLMNTVKADDDLHGSNKSTAVALVAAALMRLQEETDSPASKSYNDTELDYYGDIEIDPRKTYNAKPLMVNPDDVNYFTALQMINLYCMIGMPCLVVYKKGYGIYTCITGISYEMLMYIANDTEIDRAWFTDGQGMAVIK